MKTEYELRFDPSDTERKWPMECDRCGSNAPTAEHKWDDLGKLPNEIPKDRAPMELLCVFCYETHFGSILKYRHMAEHRDIARALCQALNIMRRGEGDRTS